MEICDREFCDLMLWIPKNSKDKNFCVIRVLRSREHWTKFLEPALNAFEVDLAKARGAIATSFGTEGVRVGIPSEGTPDQGGEGAEEDLSEYGDRTYAATSTSDTHLELG